MSAGFLVQQRLWLELIGKTNRQLRSLTSKERTSIPFLSWGFIFPTHGMTQVTMSFVSTPSSCFVNRIPSAILELKSRVECFNPTQTDNKLSTLVLNGVSLTGPSQRLGFPWIEAYGDNYLKLLYSLKKRHILSPFITFMIQDLHPAFQFSLFTSTRLKPLKGLHSTSSQM